jgi:hypothetical protein
MIWAKQCITTLNKAIHPSIYETTAPSGPRSPSWHASIHPYFHLFSSSIHFPFSQVVVYLSNPSEASLRFSQNKFFYGLGYYPHAQTPTWWIKVSLFVWVITFDLSGMGVAASSYATTDLALRIISAHKPYHYVKVGTHSGGSTKPSHVNYRTVWFQKVVTYHETRTNKLLWDVNRNILWLIPVISERQYTTWLNRCWQSALKTFSF